MSKYIKLEDAIDNYRLFEDVSYGLCKLDDYIAELPTVEVSEDCISRKDLIERFLADNECEREEAKACMVSLDLVLELIEDAPSVPKLPKEEDFCSWGEAREEIDEL